jgi:hypothetical protein
MPDRDLTETIRGKFPLLAPLMGEKVRWHWAAAEAFALGSGGTAAIARATGLSRTTVSKGITELRRPPASAAAVPADRPRERRPVGGRKSVDRADRSLIEDLEDLIAPGERGNPRSPPRWACESGCRLAERSRWTPGRLSGCREMPQRPAAPWPSRPSRAWGGSAPPTAVWRAPPPRRCGAGGRWWARSAPPMTGNSWRSSPAAGATRIGSGRGHRPRMSSPITPAWRSRSAICRRGRASGAEPNDRCPAASPSNGVDRGRRPTRTPWTLSGARCRPG